MEPNNQLQPNERPQDNPGYRPPAAPPPGPPQPQGGQTAGPPPSESNYSMKSAIIDAIANKLGFGTPIRNMETMQIQEDAERRAAQSHAFAMQQEEIDAARDATLHNMAPYMAAVARPGSRYYKDLSHMTAGLNRDEKTMAFFGGKHEISDSGKKDAAGDTLWDITIRDPKSNQVVEAYQATAPGAIDRYDASLDPVGKLRMREEITKQIEGQNRELALLEKYRNAGYATKKTIGLPTSAMDLYLDLKNHPPPGTEDLKDWQRWEAVGGQPIPPRYKVIGNEYVKHGKNGVGILAQDRENGKMEIYPIEGMRWDQVREKTKTESMKWKQLYWPDTDETLPAAKTAKGIFARRLDSTHDTMGQAFLLHSVLPRFQAWIEGHTGTTDGGQELTAEDIAAKLDAMIGGKDEKAAAETQPAAVTDDKNDFRHYLTGPNSKKPIARQGESVSAAEARRQAELAKQRGYKSALGDTAAGSAVAPSGRAAGSLAEQERTRPAGAAQSLAEAEKKRKPRRKPQYGGGGSIVTGQGSGRY